LSLCVPGHTLRQLPQREVTGAAHNRVPGCPGRAWSLTFDGTCGLRTSSFLGGEKENVLFESVADVQTILDPQEAAESAGLRSVSDARPGIARKGSKRGFTLTRVTHTRVDSSKLTEVLRRIKSLAAPLAWTPAGTDVSISPFADGYVQTTGRDARTRKHDRSHPRFREVTQTICREYRVHLDRNFVLKVKSENRLRGERSGLRLEEAAGLATL
jgi:hypothetical protein